MVGDSSQLKVHVHTDDPGRALGLGTSVGTLSAIEIDNMREQTAARRRRLAEGASAVTAPHYASSASSASVAPDPGLTQLVAVVAGEGNKNLFRNLGVDFIVDGGQSMNPSAQELLSAVEEAVAPSVIILPNNANVIMTAEQTLHLTAKDVHVVPTKSVQAGLSAAVAYDRRSAGEQNARDMSEAIAGVATGEVTRAVRDSLVDGVQVKTDDFIGLVDDRVIAASEELSEVVREVVARLLDGGREMLTVLVGEGADGDRARELLGEVRSAHPEVEIESHEGGQPYYPLLLSAE